MFHKIRSIEQLSAIGCRSSRSCRQLRDRSSVRKSTRSPRLPRRTGSRYYTSTCSTTLPTGVESDQCVDRAALDHRGCENIASGDEREGPDSSAAVSVTVRQQRQTTDDPEEAVESADVSVHTRASGVGPVFLSPATPSFPVENRPPPLCLDCRSNAAA